MFVKAPYLASNGSASEAFRKVRIQAGGSTQPYYPSIDAAFAVAGNGAAYYDTRSGDTSKQFMQNGVIGYRRYKNTPYRAAYVEYLQDGEIHQVTRRSSTRFLPEVVPIWLGPGTLPYSVYVAPHIDDINPKGTSMAAEAIASRALMANLRNRAIAEARERAMRKTIDLSESLVDLNKTVMLVANRTIQLSRAWMAVRKGNFQGAAIILGLKRLKGVKYTDRADIWAKIWLEFQYGWLPLLNDIFDGVETVQKLLGPSDPPVFSVVRRLSTPLLMRGVSVNSSRFNSFQQSSTATGSVEVRYRLEIRDAEAAFINSIGLGNPLNIAWAALPFSFVIDWLIPVGTLLSVVSAPIGLKFVSGYCSSRAWGEQTVSSSDAKSLYPYTKVASKGTARSTVKAGYFDREVFSSWPSVVPYIRFPFSSNQRIASAIALIQTSRSMR